MGSTFCKVFISLIYHLYGDSAPGEALEQPITKFKLAMLVGWRRVEVVVPMKAARVYRYVLVITPT